MVKRQRDEAEIARKRKECEVCGTTLPTGGRRNRGNTKGSHFEKKHPEYRFNYLEGTGRVVCATCNKEVGSFGRLVGHYQGRHPEALIELVVQPKVSVLPVEVAPLDLIDALVATGRDPAIVLWDGLMTTLGQLRTENQALEDANRSLRAQVESLSQELEADRRSRLSRVHDAAKDALAVHSKD